MKRISSPLIASLTFFCAISAFAARRERIIDTWRPDNYRVALTLNDSLNEITRARAEITLTVLKDKVTTVDLDFGQLTVDAVSVGGKPARFEHPAGLLSVHLEPAVGPGRRVVIAVDYHGRPKDGLILAADKDGKPSATGDNWPNRVHHWIPCFDHPSAKATVTFAVTAPARELVVANGKFAGVQNDSPTTRTWTYVEAVPIPAYCMVIAVGEYARLEPATPLVSALSYYVPQSDAKLALQGFLPAAPSLKFFSETVAPYPYEKLALIVGATRFGGMENSSAIVFPSTLLNPRTGSPKMSRAFNVNQGLERVIAHEIAHQWFGDSVTESTWADLWLSEGFATYFAGLFIQKHDGEDAFRDYMKEAANNYLAYEKRTRLPIHDTETEDLMSLLNANNYQKGAWVLHMLRSQLGDNAFFRGLRIYYLAHKDATANSEDLRAALEKASGKDLKEFFNRWVYGSGHPRYEVQSDWSTLANGKVALLVHVSQKQPGDAFLDAVTIEVTSGGIKTRRSFLPTSKLSTVSFSLTAPPTDVRLDPDEILLKEVAVAK